MDFRKSSYSSSNGGQCVEVGGNDVILVRDTTDPDGTMLAFSVASWQLFLTGLK